MKTIINTIEKLGEELTVLHTPTRVLVMKNETAKGLVPGQYIEVLELTSKHPALKEGQQFVTELKADPVQVKSEKVRVTE